MARAKINRSQLVRDYVASHPAATVKEVHTALLGTGLKLSNKLVRVVMERANVSPKKKKYAPRCDTTAHSGKVDVAELRRAVTFIRSFRKPDVAKATFELALDLQGV